MDGGSARGPINQGQVIFVASSALFERGDVMRKARKYQVGVLEDLAHSERISNCREIMELKMALRAVELSSPEFVLLDGSLEALIKRDNWVTPFGARYREQSVRRFLDKLLSGISEAGIKLTEDFAPVTLNPEYGKVIDAIVEDSYRSEFGESPRRDEFMRARVFLERCEMIHSLHELLSKSRNLVAIAKRSSSHTYFESEIPDIEVVRRFFGTMEGFLRPKEIELNSPSYYGIDARYPLTLTYARLERGANPLRVEVVGHHDEGSLARIMGSLACSSIRGYPYHLRIVHEMAKVKWREMVYLMRNLRVIDWVTGREFLGE